MTTDKNNLPDLPQSDDKFWGEAEKHVNKPQVIHLCDTHTRDNWMTHTHYVDNHDGTVSCKFCPWGTRLPGYMRFLEGRIVDLRTLAG